MKRLAFLLFILPALCFAQNKKISLDDIFKGSFRGEVFNGFETPAEESLFDPNTLKDELGKKLSYQNYVVNKARNYAIFENEIEPIYRRSAKGYVRLYDVNTKKTIQLSKDKVLHPTFSPKGDKIAWVENNNLYVYDIASGKTTPVTRDGKWNEIINGNCDWVYEEEFEFTQAYDWSADGNYIAYYRFDESRVKEYSMTMYDASYNKQYNYKYPKAGEENSKVEIHIYNLASAKDVKASYEQGDVYIPRIKWTQNDSKLVVYWMNRHQDHLKLLMTDANTGASSTVYDEQNKCYVEINDNWWYLKNGSEFIFTSEMNGYTQLYCNSFDGKKKAQLSKMKFDVTDINSVDEKNRVIYYTLAWPTPMDRNLFASDFDGKKTWQLTSGSGWHRAELNSDYTQFYDYYSTINTPQIVNLYDLKKSKNAVSSVFVKTANQNNLLVNKMKEYALGKVEFFKIANRDGDSLNAFILKPADFNPARKYPVLFCNYGGPGSQEVLNRFGYGAPHWTGRMPWYQMLAQNGFIIVSVDNTGTGARGEAFKKKTYLQLGKYEIQDQIDAAKYMAKQSYVDPAKIGHWGWSFGGFMSSLAITKGADVFSAAVAVAPVTSWRFYDNIYTERYMRTPQENKEGYDDNAPLNFTNNIKGKFLLIHGTADDNVHFQNSVEFVKALVKSGVDFESAYYPNKNHGISGLSDGTTMHLYKKMTSWLYENLRDAGTVKTY